MKYLYDRRWIQFQMMAMNKNWDLEVNFDLEKCIVKFEGKEVIFNPNILKVYAKEFIVEKIQNEFDVLSGKIEKNKKVKKSKRVTFIVFDEYHEYE